MSQQLALLGPTRRKDSNTIALGLCPLQALPKGLCVGSEVHSMRHEANSSPELCCRVLLSALSCTVAATLTLPTEGAFLHSTRTAPIITLFIPGRPLKTTHLQKHA